MEILTRLFFETTSVADAYPSDVSQAEMVVNEEMLSSFIHGGCSVRQPNETE